jgi:hypothetical protein
MTDLLVEIGFTGTRKGINEIQKNEIKKYLKYYIENSCNIIARHGDCIGADTDFHNICIELSKDYPNKINIYIHPPINKKYRAYNNLDNNYNNIFILPEKEYLERNKDIVNNSDILLAAPEDKNIESTRSGTWFTIRYAKKYNKKIKLF